MRYASIGVFQGAARAASHAGCPGLGAMIMAIGRLHRANIDTRLEALMDVGEILPAHRADIERG